MYPAHASHSAVVFFTLLSPPHLYHSPDLSLGITSCISFVLYMSFRFIYEQYRFPYDPRSRPRMKFQRTQSTPHAANHARIRLRTQSVPHALNHARISARAPYLRICIRSRHRTQLQAYALSLVHTQQQRTHLPPHADNPVDVRILALPCSRLTAATPLTHHICLRSLCPFMRIGLAWVCTNTSLCSPHCCRSPFPSPLLLPLCICKETPLTSGKCACCFRRVYIFSPP